MDKRKKSIEQAPEKKWIVTWNDYLATLLGFIDDAVSGSSGGETSEPKCSPGKERRNLC
ncbi:MAG: hypothetical protein OEL81_01425 [Nitrosopumilus sp.]|nr:hypothetical protein [Nitrosopumilus sp.]